MKMFKKETFRFLLRSITGTLIFGLAVFVTLAADSTPPKISDIVVTEVTEHSATVIWKTNDKADSQINYGLSNDYGIVREPVADKKTHEILLEDLEAATTYHFRALSADEFGNQTVSGDFTLTTEGVMDSSVIEEVVEEKDQQQLAARVISIIDEITDPEALILISNKIKEVAERIVVPPMIIGTPYIEDVGENYVVINWRTDRNSTSLIAYATEEDYNPAFSDIYTHTQGNTQDHVLEHSIEIVGLKPATTYHFKAYSEDILGLEGKSRDEKFTTTSPLPILRNIQINKVEETAATFSWSTTVPAAGYVEYTNLTTGQVKTEGSPELIAGHTVRLTDLVLGTQYSAIVRAENMAGDKISSDPMMFITVKDEYPPVISKMNNESTLYPGENTKIQTIVSWNTDEAAYCQMFYKKGVDPTAEPDEMKKEMAAIEDHVQVVVEFLPSTVYKFWVKCHDEAGNESRSEDFVLFTPEKEKSIIDIILENFEGAFGWVKNI